jgi:hypothetical protein
MSKPVVESDKVDHTVHDLLDYAFAKQVVADHPRIINIYDKLLPVLYAYAAYQAVWPVIQIVEDSKLLADMQLDYYKKIYTTKGIVDAKKTNK